MNNQKGTALITGGAKRIGREIAVALAKMGYDLVVHYNKSDLEAKTLQKEIEDIGVKCELIKADLFDNDEVTNLVSKLEKIKNWNLLVNNASIFFQSKFLDSDIENLDRNLTIHLKIPLILSKSLAINCLANKIPGNIINMIDKNIVRSDTKYFDYLLSKKSLFEATKILAMELAPNIRVNGIAPGFILNSIGEENPDEETKKLIKKIPLQQKGNKDNIINTIKFLLENKFITGHTIFIDGGASLNHG